MKNEEISLATKKALAHSLKEAMRHKPFSKITVKEIIENCGVNRNTFYYHFDDIYALLRWMLHEEAFEVVKHFDLTEDYEAAIRFTMNYVEENDYMISCAYNSIGRDEMKRFFYSDFFTIISTLFDKADQNSSKPLDSDFKDFLTKFFTEAIAGILVDWVEDRESRDREKIIAYLTQIIQSSLSLLE